MNQIYTVKSKPLKGKRDYRPRRVWSLQQKQEILALAAQTSTLHAARVFDVDIRLLFQWRAHERMGELAQRTWKDPGRPKRRNRSREEMDITETAEMADEEF
jgi:transposase-like protein